MNVITRSEVVSTIEAQHAAIDTLMAALVNREGELERAGLIERKDMFRPSTSGAVREVLRFGHARLQDLKAGYRLVEG